MLTNWTLLLFNRHFKIAKQQYVFKLQTKFISVVNIGYLLLLTYTFKSK
jgi:hypothetical protein